MLVLLTLLALTYVIDLCLVLYKPFWQRSRRRTFISGALVLVTTYVTALIFAFSPHVCSLLLLANSLYRALNYTRIAYGRINHHALRRLASRTILWLDAGQIILLGAWLLFARWSWLTSDHVYIVWAIALVLSSIVICSSTIRALKKTEVVKSETFALTTSELPTVTVAVPARDESDLLVRTLESILASDYPKLEILALDDQSQTKRTPEIIRSFAHQGVRFIVGEESRDGWLPKNQAYDTLVSHATGSYLLFLGADITIEPQTIRMLINRLYEQRKEMLSIMPLRQGGGPGVSLSQASRYAWELSPPRRLFHRPPALSSAWLIRRSTLMDNGGMSSVKRAVIPERAFAQKLVANDTYSFVRSSPELGLYSSKTLRQQHRSAIRLRYPALHRHIEFVWVLAAVSLFGLLGPLAIIVSSLWGSAPLLAGGLALGAYLLLAVSFALIGRAARLGNPLALFALYPLAVLQDIAVTHISMWGYEFGHISWKQRDVAPRVMEVIPRLPKI